MYNVSEQFLAMSKTISQRWNLRGTINDTVQFDKSNIIKGTMKLSNQCSSNSDLVLGSVYIGQLNCTFKSGLISRSDWQGAVIKLEFGLKVGSDYEWLPAPSYVYTVYEATHTNNGVKVVAYDNMAKFDKNLTITDISATSLYDILVFICMRCGVELDMEDLSGFPNSGLTVSLYGENDIQTYRDLLYWVAQTLGGFATINREGKLEIRRFTNTKVETVNHKNRYVGSEFSDYVTRYTGLSVVQIDEMKTKYYASQSLDNGSTINLGSNPLLQIKGTLLDTAMNAILDEIQLIQYVPFTQKWLGCIYYDLGDVIENIEGLAGTSSMCCIMAYSYSFGQYVMIKGVGANPALASAKSKSDKNIQGLLSRIDADKFFTHYFVNTQEFIIGDGSSANIISISYGTVKNTSVSFYAEIQLNIDCTDDEEYGIYDTKVTVTYINNAEEIECKPVNTYLDGDYVLHLIQKVEAVGNTIGSFIVKITSSGGTITIPVGCCKAWLEGQGLVADEQWDGILNITNYYTSPKLLEDIEVQGYFDSMNYISYIPVGGTFTDQVSSIPLLEDVGVYGYTDNIISYLGAMYNYDNMIYGSDVYVDDDNNLVTDNSTAEITTPVLAVNSITSISVVDNNATYLVSFDGGTTYMVYDGTDWIESSASSMTKAVIESVTTFPVITTGVVVKVIITDTSSVKYIWIL